MLKPGDMVGIIATSSPVDALKLDRGVEILQGIGLRTKIYESCYSTHDYLAGEDALRLADLHSAFADDDVQAVMVARGGYGAARLLPHIDFNTIRQNPKPFIGYSDVTALHVAFNQICKLPTYHAPMPATEQFAHEITQLYFRHMFLGEAPPQKLPPAKTIVPGQVRGILAGGNLSLLAASLGTPYEINTTGKILFLEEIDEEPYKVDRMLCQLSQAGKLSAAAGIILGSFSYQGGHSLQPYKIAIDSFIIPLKKPTIHEQYCGHIIPGKPLMFGVDVGFCA
ncbi:MAG: LD-carboxypeptidase [Defluviitaleaceae bacterium]|nr:LD-carboxypeptidase [Defluviitaleaceae bacterium]